MEAKHSELEQERARTWKRFNAPPPPLHKACFYTFWKARKKSSLVHIADGPVRDEQEYCVLLRRWVLRYRRSRHRCRLDTRQERTRHKTREARALPLVGARETVDVGVIKLVGTRTWGRKSDQRRWIGSVENHGDARSCRENSRRTISGKGENTEQVDMREARER